MRALLLLSLDRLGRALDLRREVAADVLGSRLDRRRHRALPTRAGGGSTCVASAVCERLRRLDVDDGRVPVFRRLVLAALLACALLASHVVFMMNEPYLPAHHC